jgi:peptide/nickel transport system permease protein
MGLTSFLIRRTINMVITVVGVIFIMFIITHVITPNPAVAWAGPHPVPSIVEAITKEYHLNDPVYVQFYYFMLAVFEGNWGEDPMYHQPIIQLIDVYFPRTLELTIAAMIVIIILGVLTGAIAAVRKNTPTDYTIRTFYLITWSMPPFLVAMLLQLAIAYSLKLLPATGLANPLLPPPKPITGMPTVDALLEGYWPYFWSSLRHLILPATALALVAFGIISRLIRNSMIDIASKPFIRTAIMKGLKERDIVFKHMLRNALIPAITVLALTFASLLAGAVVVEDVFSWTGMGWLLTQALYQQDYPLVMAGTFIVAIGVVISNLAADLLYAIVDPRIKLE